MARLTIAAVWVWHGLVPKLIYRSMDEQTMLAQAGLPLRLLPWIGGLEIAFGLLILISWHQERSLRRKRCVHGVGFCRSPVAVNSPAYLRAAFNPVNS